MYGSRHVWFHSGAILAGRENTKMSNEGDQDGWERMGNGGSWEMIWSQLWAAVHHELNGKYHL